MERLAKETNPGTRMDLIDQALRPPEPQLLDTCVLQNLDWVDRQLELRGSAVWDDAARKKLADQYGVELADDLIDLGILYKRFEHESGYPWMVCNAAAEEAGLFQGTRGARLRQLIAFFSGHQDDWGNEAYPGVAPGLLMPEGPARVSPLILRALGVTQASQIPETDGPLRFLPDRGDRLVASHALVANVPVILTTDRRTFWAHREALMELGVRVMRPVELLECYWPYWEAMEMEFKRRRAEAKPRSQRR